MLPKLPEQRPIIFRLVQGALNKEVNEAGQQQLAGLQDITTERTHAHAQQIELKIWAAVFVHLLLNPN